MLRPQGWCRHSTSNEMASKSGGPFAESEVGSGRRGRNTGQSGAKAIFELRSLFAELI